MIRRNTESAPTESPRSDSDLLPTVPLLALDRQYDVLREAIRDAINRVCDSGRFVLGPDQRLHPSKRDFPQALTA